MCIEVEDAVLLLPNHGYPNRAARGVAMKSHWDAR